MAVGDFHTRQLALIKAARSLESDKRPYDEKINHLWQLLTAAKGGDSCAAEETILRWLLKHMDGKKDIAEQIRRYPLTWTTLGCLFERISLFSLSNVFLERKFIDVLQQSAKDISSPQFEDKSKPGKDRKRKRDELIKFELEPLRSSQVLMFSASELFQALKKLLNRLTSTTSQDTEDVRFGAEHIKSIFRLPAEDAKGLVAPLLWICAHSLDLSPLHGGWFEEQERWPEIPISLWELHLGGADDPREFAAHLYYPCCLTLDKLLGPNKQQDNLVRKHSWQSQLEQLITRNLVTPAKNAFVNGNGLSILELANASSVANPAACVQTLWRIVGLASRNPEDLSTKKAQLYWAQSVFKLLLTFAEEQKVAAEIVSRILGLAKINGCPPEMDTLTHIYKNYCFHGSNDDWPLVSDIISCDAEVFLLNEELLSTLLEKVSTVTDGDENKLTETVNGVVIQLMEAFAKARDLINFAKKWYGQLSQVIAQGVTLDKTAWYDSRARHQFAELMQGALSEQQVSLLVDWLREQGHNGPALVILDAICQGVKDETYITAIGEKLRDVVLEPIDATGRAPALMASRWRITKSTVSWASANDVNTIWKHLKRDLSKALSSGSLSEPSTFEAFACSLGFCLSSYPLGENLDSTIKVACAFLKRVTDEVKDFGRVEALSDCLELVFDSFSILSKVSIGDQKISNMIGTLFSQLESHLPKYKSKSFKDVIERVPRTDVVEDEEDLVDTLFQPLISTLENPDVCGWTTPSGQSAISTLLTFSPETFTKDRRKKIMSSWRKWKQDLNGQANNPILFNHVLRLLVSVMAQPTFYDKMSFDDVLELPLNSEIAPFIVRLTQLMISQMLGHTETSADYSKQMLQYVQDLDVDEVSNPAKPLVLLSSMSVALKVSSSKAKQPLDQAQVTEKLRELVIHSISELSSKLKKPGKLVKDEQSLFLLDLALRASSAVGDSLSANPIKLSSKVISRLQEAGEALTSEGFPVGWKLQTFLALNQGVSDSAALLKQMSQKYSTSSDTQSVSDFVDVVIKELDNSAKLQLLHDALVEATSWKSHSVPQLILARIIETIPASTPLSITIEDDKTFDLASVQITLGQFLLHPATTLVQFKNTARLLELLLDKHASAMTQINIEHTLAIIGTVCASSGPVPDPKEPGISIAGEVFETLYRLVATIIRRHRLRLEGHHHLLLSTLQALLRVLLADPAKSKQSNSSFLYPRWLDTRLKARHGAKFARLITLTCEPSAASVARGKHNSLDSATDAVKRSAGQYMFWVVALYIKLQLEGDVSREMRKELATGIYSILSITPENNRRILNEAMDDSGRAIFRSLFTEWKRFGKWSGI